MSAPPYLERIGWQHRKRSLEGPEPLRLLELWHRFLRRRCEFSGCVTPSPLRPAPQARRTVRSWAFAYCGPKASPAAAAPRPETVPQPQFPQRRGTCGVPRPHIRQRRQARAYPRRQAPRAQPAQTSAESAVARCAAPPFASSPPRSASRSCAEPSGPTALPGFDSRSPPEPPGICLTST